MKSKVHRGCHAGVFVAGMVAMTLACSSSNSGGPGSGGAASGGEMAGGSGGTTVGVAGGKTANGGASVSGGASQAGGTSASGGAPGTGGSVGVGGHTELGRGGSAASGGAASGGQAGAMNGGSTPGAGGAGGMAGRSGSGGATSALDGGASSGGVSGGSSTPAFQPCPATGTCVILPLGDSITAGAGAQPGDGGGYRVELFSKAVADNKHITFVGSLTSGPTTVAGQSFPQHHEGHIGWVITQIAGIATTAQALKDKPHIVLLFIGTNDEGYASSEAGASDRLAQLIDQIVTALPDSLLVVSSIYPFPGCKSTNYTPDQCAVNVAAYDAAIPGIVKQRADAGKHVLYVDMSSPPTGALSTDGVHPNDTVGYPWMGDTWYGAIKTYLR